MKPQVTRCPHCGATRKRSSPQNRRLHKLFTEIAANVKAKDGLYHPAPWWKVMCKDRWLGYDEFEGIDGRKVFKLKETSSLEADEFNEFMANVEKFAAERGVYLEHDGGL